MLKTDIFTKAKTNIFCKRDIFTMLKTDIFTKAKCHQRI